MINFYVLTLFPEMIVSGMNNSVIGRAIENGLISLEAVENSLINSFIMPTQKNNILFF